MVFGHERPLGGGREVSTATTSQARAFDLVDDLRGGHLLEHLARGRIAAEGFVDIELVQVRGLEPLGEDGTADGASLLNPSSFSWSLPASRGGQPLWRPGGEPRPSDCVAQQQGRRSSSASGPPDSGGRAARPARTRRPRGPPPLRTGKGPPLAPAPPRARPCRP